MNSNFSKNTSSGGLNAYSHDEESRVRARVIGDFMAIPAYADLSNDRFAFFVEQEVSRRMRQSQVQLRAPSQAAQASTANLALIAKSGDHHPSLALKGGSDRRDKHDRLHLSISSPSDENSHHQDNERRMGTRHRSPSSPRENWSYQRVGETSKQEERSSPQGIRDSIKRKSSRSTQQPNQKRQRISATSSSNSNHAKSTLKNNNRGLSLQKVRDKVVYLESDDEDAEGIEGRRGLHPSDSEIYGEEVTTAGRRLDAKNANSLWYRSIELLGENIWDAIPPNMEVGRTTGLGLDWPWNDRLCLAAIKLMCCPVFKGNIPLFQYALQYAIACRCSLEKPLRPHGLTAKIDPSDKEESDPESSDESDYGSKVLNPSLTVTQTSFNQLLSDVGNASAGVHLETLNEHMSFQNASKKYQAVLREILQSHLLPKAKPATPEITPDNLLSFLSERNLLRNNSSNNTVPCLQIEDLNNIQAAWDKFAKKNGFLACEDLLKKSKRKRFRKTNAIDQWKLQQSDLRLYGSNGTSNPKARKQVKKHTAKHASEDELSDVTNASWDSPEEDALDILEPRPCPYCSANIRELDPDEKKFHKHRRCRGPNAVS